MVSGPLEKDTCRDVILPALSCVGWTSPMIVTEYPVKARRTMSTGGVERDLPDGRVDYVLEIQPGLPVAVVEAKRTQREATDGVQQSVRYADQLDVPIAYASNGRKIIERDLIAGTEREVDSFMTPAEAWSRYVDHHGLDDEGAELLLPLFNREKRSASGDVVEPRWYQRVAVHRVLAAMARSERRVLVLMATGTGKTFTAMQIVHKLRAHAALANPERNHRVLYLADREALVEQPKRKDFSTAFGDGPLWRVSGGSTRAREIYFATYQALSGGGEEAELFRDYPPDFFDVVIVDECHRGSASENSSWRRVLEYFAPAVQIGLTATPKRDDTVDTYGYFGNPVVTYSLRQGIEDGYLAPYRVRRVVLSPDSDGWEPEPGQRDRFEREIPEGRYGTRDFERVIRLLMRTDLAANYLSRTLRRDPSAKTIVFCVDQQHADDMRRALINANPELVARDPEWVVRIVGDEGEKARLLENFCDPDRSSPVVATTSRLLSTGIDVEDLKYVVLFRPVGSMVEFKQIIGRGTRLYPDKGKTSFEIIDFVGATSHFADPSFDGYPVETVEVHPGENTDDEIGEMERGEDSDDSGVESVVRESEPRFDPICPTENENGESADPGPGRASKLVVDEGLFYIVAEALQVPDISTGQLVLTEYGDFVAGWVRRLASSPANLSQRWSRQPSRLEVLQALHEVGIDPESLLPTGAEDVDPLDILLQLAWNLPAPTRAERARRVREAHYTDLETRSETAKAVIDGLLDRYEAHGVAEITSAEVTRLPPLSDLGSPREIDQAMGDGPGLRATVDELQTWIYSNDLLLRRGESA